MPVFNAPGANANAVKELVLAALLMAARNVVPALEYVACARPRDAADLEARVEEGKKQFAGIELPHRTLGIIGLGAIGSLVADTAIKLGMKVDRLRSRDHRRRRVAPALGACARRSRSRKC